MDREALVSRMNSCNGKVTLHSTEIAPYLFAGLVSKAKDCGGEGTLHLKGESRLNAKTVLAYQWMVEEDGSYFDVEIEFEIREKDENESESWIEWESL